MAYRMHAEILNRTTHPLRCGESKSKTEGGSTKESCRPVSSEVGHHNVALRKEQQGV